MINGKTAVQLTIIDPFDPLGAKVGGIETFVKGFIKFSPERFNIRMIGVTSDKILRPVKKWTQQQIGTKCFDFFPLFFEKNENKRTLIPLSLRFVLACKQARLGLDDHHPVVLNRIESALCLSRRAVPKIGLIHNDIPQQILAKSEVKWSRIPSLYLKLEKKILSELDFVYTVSKSTLSFYQTRYPEIRNKISFIPNWYDSEIFSPSHQARQVFKDRLSRQHKLPAEQNKWIIFTGRLQPQKELPLMIKAFSLYQKENRNTCLLLIGEGDQKKELEKNISRLNLSKRVFLMGKMEQKRITDFYRAADLFLLTSRYEGMPISILESLGCGLPVVTTQAGEVSKVIKNGFSGEIVPDFSHESIARSICKVLDHPECYTLENCINSVSTFTPEGVLSPIFDRLEAMEIQDKSR